MYPYRLSGFWEIDLNSWDIAAGYLLVHEAGGKVTDTEGTPINLFMRDIVATTGKGTLHTDLVKLLVDSNGCHK